MFSCFWSWDIFFQQFILWHAVIRRCLIRKSLYSLQKAPKLIGLWRSNQMSQAFDDLFGSDMLSASSIILRCAVLYKEFTCLNHNTCIFWPKRNKHSQCEMFFYGTFFQRISLFCQQCWNCWLWKEIKVLKKTRICDWWNYSLYLLN